jgi:solute carrier family 25 carnitine/acylcarnitine transporter 20/29
VGSAFYFGTYEFVVRHLSPDRNKATFIDFILAGGIAGLSYWVTAYPMDTIKTNIQANKPVL